MTSMELFENSVDLKVCFFLDYEVKFHNVQNNFIKALAQLYYIPSDLYQITFPPFFRVPGGNRPQLRKRLSREVSVVSTH